MLSRLKHLLSPITSRLLPPPETKSSSWTRAWLVGRDHALPNSSALRDPFNQSTWVYACVTALAENVSAIPLRLLSGPEDNERVIQDHPALSLFNSPHPHLDRFQFWELIVTWLCLRGEAFILPVSSSVYSASSVVPSSLLVLNPDHLQEVIEHNQLAGWRYTPHSAFRTPHSAAVFLPEELVHIKLPNPLNFWRGMSPLTVAWLAVQTDYASSQFMKGTMLNNADTGLIVTTTEQLTDEQRQQFSAALRERKRAAGTADRTIFLSGGAKVEKPTISAVDLQFLENRKFNRQEICAIFKVPQEVLGFSEDANRSVSESARLNFMENRIAPLCKRLEVGVQPIIDRFRGGQRSVVAAIRGEFHISGTPIMQAAQRARIDCALKLFSVGVPINIANRLLDLGLPILPHGDTPYLPTTVSPVSVPPNPNRNLNPTPNVGVQASACPVDSPNPALGLTPPLESKIATTLSELRELLRPA